MLTTVYTKTLRERWIGPLVGVLSVLAIVVMALSVYVDLDDLVTELAESMPPAFLSVLGIDGAGGSASLVLGEVLNLIGPLVLSGLAISMGTAAIAGEERQGTLGVLLANPRNRTEVLVGKAGVMLTTTVAAGALIWAGTIATTSAFDASTEGLTVGAMALHMVMIALFFGALAQFLGSWTGNASLASAVTVAAMVVSFLAAGLFPLIEGWENIAKAFPWYYFNGSQPLQNGVAWGHIAVLGTLSIALLIGAIIGVNRRDLRIGESSTALLDRLKGNPRLNKVLERMSGQARVSGIGIKTVSESRTAATIGAISIFYMALLIGPMYNAISDVLSRLMEAIPEALITMVGGVDMSTPEGWYYGEMFSMVVPGVIAAIAIMMGSRALAGEESAGTMDLLMANPIPRHRIVGAKTGALVVVALALGVLTWLGTWAGSLLGGLGISISNIAAISLQASLLGLVFGTAALLGGAATGSKRVATYTGTGLALVGWAINSFFPVSPRLAEWARLSPFYYFAENEPLVNGADWGNIGVMVAIIAVFTAASVFLFARRDLRT